jgi:hypothetical protein
MNRIFAPAVAIAVACSTSSAFAQQAFTQDKPQVSGHVAYGAWMGDGGLNFYALGLGARAGYTVNPGVYVGGLFDFFFGETEDTTGPVVLGIPTVSTKSSGNSWLLEGEVGYDFALSPSFVLRPKIGLGITQLAREDCATAPLVGETCNDDSDGKFAFQVGLEAPIGLNGLFVAPEFRFNIVDDASGFILAVGIGAAF